MRIMNEEKLQMMLMFIKQYARDNNGAAPSLTTIMENLKMAKSTTYRYILELEKRGVISYKGKRTLESSQQRKMKCNCCRIPLVGKIICGSPDVQEEHIDSYMALPEEWLDGECFLLEAYGDSMIDIGIDEGDLILVKKTEFPTDGDVVVALTENGNTLKRFFWENGRARLHAENKLYNPKDRDIYPKKLIIQGIILKVIKNIR